MTYVCRISRNHCDQGDDVAADEIQSQSCTEESQTSLLDASVQKFKKLTFPDPREFILSFLRNFLV